MKRIVLITIGLIIFIAAEAAQVSLSGSRVIEVLPDANTGLNSIYVVENANGITIEYKSNGNSNITFQRYSNLGGGFAEDITNVTHNGNKYSFTADASDMGYIITEKGNQTCFWIVNYANHYYDITTLEVLSADCDRVTLHADESADCIAYYTINGRREVLDREIKVRYNTLVYSDEEQIYNQVATEENIEWFDTSFNVPTPLCDTEFIITPDRFASIWGLGDEIISSTFQTNAVQAQTSIVQTIKENDNEQKVEAELGGSAPCEMTFKAAITDAAIYHRWEISTYPEFDDVQLQYNELEFSYTFTEAGMTYVRFIANNAEGTCEYIGETYTISIGDSRLECPNAFSPGTSEGVNDEWKVSYRSIVSFNCQIFNRWGQRIIELTDPSQGWNGTYNGKLVKSGTYFYVIKARGSDNKDYELSGHINIIGSRSNSTGVTDGSTEETPVE